MELLAVGAERILMVGGEPLVFGELRIGLQELRAILLAVVIITTWAAIRYGRATAPTRDHARG